VGLRHYAPSCSQVASSLHLTPGGTLTKGGRSHPRSNVYFATLDPEDADAVQLGCGLFAGVAMVALQCMVVIAVFSGISPACGSSDQCPQAGMYCDVGAKDRCTFCGEDAPLPPQTDPATGGTLNNPYAPAFAGFNLTAVAELCTDPGLYKGDWVTSRDCNTASSICHTASTIVSWCKFGTASLAFFLIPGPFRLARDECRSQARPASTRSTARWTH
jgi:hypothetical protein